MDPVACCPETSHTPTWKERKYDICLPLHGYVFLPFLVVLVGMPLPPYLVVFFSTVMLHAALWCASLPQAGCLLPPALSAVVNACYAACIYR